MDVQGPRGTNDILPGTVEQWQYVEARARDILEKFGYSEIRLPIFEHTELFERGIGETTDIVEKEMYTFKDKGGRSLTLRPEGTAPVVRSFLQHKLYGGALPVKLYYIGPMFRYERPQAGRYRQFYQLGAEAIGTQDPVLDVEMMAIPVFLYSDLGLGNLEIRLNSIGCPMCRPRYRDRLKDHFRDKLEHLCSSCRSRYERNPMRILDCKVETCRQEAEHAPTIENDLCDECRTHFEAVKTNLDTLGIAFEVDPRLVRGFDYYTKTVFEVVREDLGAQDAINGGGRYDGLVEEVGGRSLPAVGFAAGIERILLALEQQGIELPGPKPLDVYVASVGVGTRPKTVETAFELRRRGWRVELDYAGKGLRAQMKAAGRAAARCTLILGEEELKKGTAVVRDMAAGTQREVAFAHLVPECEQVLKGSGKQGV